MKSIRNNTLHSRHQDIQRRDFVKTFEELGIGRPSTYAPTLDTIQKRGYVTLDAKRFIPTELGEIVHQAVNQYFPDIIDVEFTAQMEKGLIMSKKAKSNG